MAGRKAADFEKPFGLNTVGYRQSTKETFLDIFGEQFEDIFGGRIARISGTETSFFPGTGAEDNFNAIPEGGSAVAHPKQATKR